MFTIEPRPACSMPGRNARSVLCIDLTLMSNEKSQSWSEHSSTVPWCTKPAALSRMSIVPTRLAIATMAAVSRTSSRATSDTPSLVSGARPVSSISVAKTVAPSRANAMAHARPIPAAPAVTNARLPLRRSPIHISLDFNFSFYRLIAGMQKDKGNPDWFVVKWIASLRSRWARRNSPALMIIPCDAHPAGNVVIAGGELHAGAGGMLADGGAIQLLPGCLVGRMGKAALSLQFRAPPLQLLIGYQDIGAAIVKID